MVQVTRAELNWTIEGQKPLSCGLWFDATAGFPTLSELVDTADRTVATLDDALGGNTMLGLCDNSTVFGRATAQNWNASPGVLVPASIEMLSSTSPAACTGSGGQPPPQARACVRIRTSDPRRRARGRVYLPICDEESLEDPGTMTTGAAAFYNLFVPNWISAIVLGLPGLVDGVLSRKFGTFALGVEDVSCDRRVRSQRRGQLRTRVT